MRFESNAFGNRERRPVVFQVLLLVGHGVEIADRSVQRVDRSRRVAKETGMPCHHLLGQHVRLSTTFDVFLSGQIHLNALRHRRMKTEIHAIDQIGHVTRAIFLQSGIDRFDRHEIIVASFERFDFRFGVFSLSL